MTARHHGADTVEQQHTPAAQQPQREPRHSYAGIIKKTLTSDWQSAKEIQIKSGCDYVSVVGTICILVKKGYAEKRYDRRNNQEYRIRTRPHTPAPEHGMCDACCNHPEVCIDVIKQHDAAIARTATLAAYKKVLDDCCKECPIKEEIPVEDYCAESCEGCLVRTTVESLRQQAGEQHE